MSNSQEIKGVLDALTDRIARLEAELAEARASSSSSQPADQKSSAADKKEIAKLNYRINHLLLNLEKAEAKAEQGTKVSESFAVFMVLMIGLM
jgi:hypothetical protein